VDTRRIDALDQWCLRTLLGIKWHQFVCNKEVRRITKQPNLTAIIQSQRLSIFRHIARMDDDADGKMILMAPYRELEETTRAFPYHMAEHHLTRPESPQPHTERSSRSGSEPPSVEADVYVWRYALLVVHASKEEESTPHPKRHLDRFSRFCTAHRKEPLHFTTGHSCPFSLKNAPFHGDLNPQLIHGFFGPPESSIQTAS